jgi:hypothetical protein
VHDKDGLIFAGRDSYYHNSVYTQGWTYYNQIIGNPFLQINNNRVRAHFLGLGGSIYGYNYRLITSHVNNYGSYQKPTFSSNHAILLEINKRFEKAWGLQFGATIAADLGTQYGNQWGALIRITKIGDIITY